ncbi:MAG: diguanylate cyclase [Spirochaetota bacterium]
MQRQTIFIIDDDPNIGKTLSDILTAKGYDVSAAGSGKEGLDLLKQTPANLVIIDLGLPDISGLEVLGMIKAGNPFTEAIILTGNASLDSAIEATNRGAFSYLLKPYDIDQLIVHIRRAFEKQQAQEEIALHNTELKKINTELQILNEISLAISKTIELNELLQGVLQVIANMDIFETKSVGAAFLVEEGRLRLVASIGYLDSGPEICNGTRTGECLCGLAVKTGQVLVSKNSGSDARHCTMRTDIADHGHIIIPLKLPGKVIGVISLQTHTGMQVSEQTLRLLSTLGNQIGIAVNNAHLYEEAKDHSLHDPLTGLANRRFMQIELEKKFKYVERYGWQLAIIMIDIDFFKKYNDERGHVEGDRLLVAVANLLLREIRTSDYVFRYGGEEFLIIFPRSDRALLLEAAERLRKSVETNTEVTISIGIAMWHKDMANIQSLIASADTALYKAKQEGRNRVILAE